MAKGDDIHERTVQNNKCKREDFSRTNGKIINNQLLIVNS